MRRSRWPNVDASAGQVLMLAVAKWSASLQQYHLFGILYSLYIQDADFTADDIAEDAGLSRKHGIEIRKGIRLSKYVVMK